jgi:hypothetical protein
MCVYCRHCFLQLIWTMKLLTLDRPADLKRCRVPFQKARLVATAPSARGGADVVKCILGLRRDFSREAILRMRIDTDTGTDKVDSSSSSAVVGGTS